MTMRVLTAALLASLLPTAALASSRLLYFEAQGVAGYSDKEDGIIFHSESAEDVMQKSSVGFDFIQRLSGETGDFGMIAVQGRLAYDPDAENEIEPQLYNAYYKHKAGWADIWAGHSRPAFGLSSVLDTHALLLPTLAMHGFGFDRDWGVSAGRDFAWGNLSASVTAGSGMPLRLEGNYLASARISKGVLSQDNWELGLSLGAGETLHTMGYEVMHDEPLPFAMTGADFTYLWDNYEARFEAMGGTNRDEDALALFACLGMNLLDEGRLKLEIQPEYSKIGEHDGFRFSAGPTYQLTDELALRAMYRYDEHDSENQAVMQIYYYRKI
jgi:opacity protein-like surface antigen